MSEITPLSLEEREAAVLKREAELDAREAELVEREAALAKSVPEEKGEEVENVEPPAGKQYSKVDQPGYSSATTNIYLEASSDVPVLEPIKAEEKDEKSEPVVEEASTSVEEAKAGEPVATPEVPAEAFVSDKKIEEEAAPAVKSTSDEESTRAEEPTPVAEETTSAEKAPDSVDLTSTSHNAPAEESASVGESLPAQNSLVEEAAPTQDGVHIEDVKSEDNTSREKIPISIEEAIPTTEQPESQVADEAVKEDLQAFIAEREPVSETLPADPDIPAVADDTKEEEAPAIESKPVVEEIPLPALEKLTLDESTPVASGEVEEATTQAPVQQEEAISESVPELVVPAEENTKTSAVPEPIAV